MLVIVYLKCVVEWEPIEEDVREKLPQTEDAVHHPVRQPFCVVLFVHALDRLNSGTNKNELRHRKRLSLHLDDKEEHIYQTD